MKLRLKWLKLALWLKWIKSSQAVGNAIWLKIDFQTLL
jgi:hypothetical protein